MNEYINIKNARIHNLKGIDIQIPKNKLTVITGVSGSGKSSLAFDTLYEEGKRRYLMFSDTQFMAYPTPTFDKITGLSPTIAVEQRIIRQSNPRSTVGTRTKITNMLAMLFATYGKRNSKYDDGEPLSIEMFQKNSPKGMCVKCLGKGTLNKLDENRIFENNSHNLYNVFGLDLGLRGKTRKMLDEFCNKHQLKIDQSVSQLTDEQLNILKYGDGGKTFIGYIPWITQICNGTFSTSGRLLYLLTKTGYMQIIACPKCAGTGLSIQASHTTIMGKTISELEKMYIKDLSNFLNTSPIKSKPIIDEICVKLNCMSDVGLQHLTLSRPVPTLSGGEIQRLFLASYIIAEMDSIIFIFDEPTMGLHEVEKAKLINILKNLVNRGNTVIAVEHDENFILSADYIIDLGPNAGVYGGYRIFQGSLNDFLHCESSNTAPYLKNKNSFNIKTSYKPIDFKKILRIENADLHNLQNITVDIPLGLMVGIAGVSGSGKSSLISDTLVPKLKELFKTKNSDKDDEDESFYESNSVTISGTENIRNCFLIDQKPIGRSRTSCPATYTGMFDRIRALFSKTSGLPAGLFTVNSEGGCRMCKGDGEIHYHVGYGNFIDFECEACQGTGFISEAMDVIFYGKNIKDILALTVDEAAEFFKNKDKTIEKILATLIRVGMGYITLGQKTPTISGGESQRIKLAKELSKGENAKNNVYILDEPTTGLSFHDSLQLMMLMQELVDKGNTVIVTEHDPYVLSNCDYIIEMGVGGGSDGGNVIAKGTAMELKTDKNSIIGRYLK